MDRLVNRANRYLREDSGEMKEVLYGNVIYLQGEEAHNALDIVDKKGEDAAIEYLLQWDTGEYNDVYNSYKDVIGSNDRTYETDNYVLAYKSQLDYISLFIKLDKEEFITRYGEEGITEQEEVVIDEDEETIDEDEELTEGSPQKLKRYETPKDIPGVRGASAIGWKYDTNGNPVVVVELIKDGKGRNKSIQLASIEDGEKFESELKNDKELGKNLLNNLKDNLNKKEIKEEEDFTNVQETEENDVDEGIEPEYIGILELEDKDGEYHVFEIMKTDTHLLFGSSTNTGFSDDGRMEIDTTFSTDENLQELNADLEVMINDGEKYTSNLEFKPYKKDNTVEESSDEEETPKLRSVKITYDSGDVLTTDVSGKLTDEEIFDYFKIGRSFNIGNIDDKMVKVKQVDILENEEIEETEIEETEDKDIRESFLIKNANRFIV